MTPVSLPSGSYLFVEIPEGATDFEIDEILSPYLQYWIGNEDTIIDLPSGSYTLIGLVSEMEEEDWKEIVEYEDREEMVDFNAGGGGRIKYCVFKDYCALENGYETDLADATESGLSLLQHHNLQNKPVLTYLILKRD